MRNINLIICTICMFQLAHHTTGEVDEQCEVDCACCLDRKCGPGQWFPNQCTLGCIDGHRAARCYIRCTHNCTKCPDYEDTCTECYDGYYPGYARDCTSKCLPGCKTCTSGTTCISCKEGYYNADGQNDCSTRICPKNCVCDNGQCASCKDGYYDTNSCSTEQSVNTAVLILGTGFAVSVVVNIIFVVTLILWNCRKRVNGSRNTKGPLNVNSDIELECGNSANAGNVSNHRIVQATNNDIVLNSHDYEDLGRVQVSEHEYGLIRPDTGFH